MFDLLKKAYESACAAKNAACTRKDELRARYEEFKEHVIDMWNDLELHDEKFTLSDGTTLSITTKAVGFTGSITHKVLDESEQTLATFFEEQAAKYNDMYAQ